MTSLALGYADHGRGRALPNIGAVAADAAIMLVSAGLAYVLAAWLDANVLIAIAVGVAYFSFVAGAVHLGRALEAAARRAV